MKRLIKIVFLLFVICLICGILIHSRYMYGRDYFTVQNMRCTAHNFLPICFASAYSWSLGENHAVLDIPYVCERHYVASLGGHDMEPFLVNLQGSRYVCSESALPSDAHIQQYHLAINIEENILLAEYIAMDVYHCIRSNEFVQILVTVKCSEKNPVFYSEDGKLYRRADNSLVEGFFYYSDYVG